MGGITMTSTLAVTTRVPLSVSSRSKMETASEDSLRLSGHLIVRLLVTVMRCCSTCLAAVTSQPNKQERRYGAVVGRDFILVEVVIVS